ncbi:putative zinc metallo proteinase [Aulographum hederae CBS 113979]|uniref:Putative zinc metallo proteinase n=1 Tax=Aulographum hederae CBS 113979 TaxID=1176131 RepID=A0A6G1H3S7_9PEZI|nr:putative zinc metallo proteinase [Aulographum hederae CBS 113979]
MRRKTSKHSIFTRSSSSSKVSMEQGASNSSSTVDTTSSPPSSLPPRRSTSNLNNFTNGGNNGYTNGNGNGNANGAPPIPPRPGVPNKRYSVGSMSQLGNGAKTPPLPSSPLAPVVTNFADNNAMVNIPVVLVSGRIGEPGSKSRDGTVTVQHHDGGLPAMSWPVTDSHFKALVYLHSGRNALRLEYVAGRASVGNPPPHVSTFHLSYLPNTAVPPLHLAILLAKNSLGTYDAVPERAQREGNNLETAERKFRTAAALWQAFTAEQMARNRLGRRCFRLEEEWQTGSLCASDWTSGQMRSETKIHIIRLNQTVEEIRALDIAQQYEKANDKGKLFSIAMDAVNDYFKTRPGQKKYVSCMFLDSHWDPETKTIRGHAALGGGSGDTQLAIFGSHALHTYPTSLDEVTGAFSDCTRTDTKYVANDCNESGSYWEAANIGIGAHLHETGHLFGCPHQESGVMLRDYVKFNRSFMTHEPYSTRTRSQGHRLCLAEDECGWHRLDLLRFRIHPCFRLPQESPFPSDDTVQVWSADSGSAMVTSTSNIAFVEMYTEGEDICRTHFEYVDSPGSSRQLTFVDSELRSRLPADKRNKKLRLEIYSMGGGRHTIDDFSAFTSKSSMVKLANGQKGFRSGKLGFSRQDGTEHQELIMDSAVIQTKLLTSIKVYHGFALDGIEFVHEDHSSQLFGKRGGSPSEFSFDTRKSEQLLGFYVRAGLWIDGLQILTTLGRKSEIYGNPTGGSGHTLVPPRGYRIAGVSGSHGAWVDGFALIIAR